MAVIWKVRQAAESRGIMSASRLAVLAQLNKNTANELWNGAQLRVDRVTLGKLCEALGCELADLLEYSPGHTTKPAATLTASF